MADIITLKQKEKLKSLLRQYPKIIAGYIFGSRLKGQNHPDSDLDIGLICFDKNGVSPLDLTVKISKIILKPEVDVVLVDLKSDPLLLIQMASAKVIYEKSLGKRTLLENKILLLYEDSKPLTAIKNYYLEKSFKEGLYAH